MSSSGLKEEKSSCAVLKCSEPGMCCARTAHSLRAITSLNLSSLLSNSSSSSSRVKVLIPDEEVDVFLSCLRSALFSPGESESVSDGTESTQFPLPRNRWLGSPDGIVAWCRLPKSPTTPTAADGETLSLYPQPA